MASTSEGGDILTGLTDGGTIAVMTYGANGRITVPLVRPGRKRNPLDSNGQPLPAPKLKCGVCIIYI
jgi:hypothetical protein